MNGVLAVACTYVIITSGIDLSVGTLMTFCAVMAGVVLTKWGMPLPLGILAALCFGALSGSVSGFVIAKMKVPPFIATLGMMMLLKGLSLVISGTRPIYFNDTPGFTSIAQDSLIGNLDSGAADSERGADPVPRRDRRVDRAEPHDLRPLRSRSAATRKRCGCRA